MLIIGANLDSANELARGLAKDRGAAFGWHRMTLTQLAAVLAAPLLAKRKLAPLSRLGVEAIAARVVHRLKAEHGLGRYKYVGDTPGFARAIAATISELRLAKLTSDAITKVAPDLVVLSEAYEAALEEAGLTDWSGVLALATEAASGRVHRLVGLPMLLLDVPITNEAEFAFLTGLAGASSDTLATVPVADQPTVDRIFAAQFWKTEDLDAERKKDHLSTLGTLARLQRQLFSDYTTVLQAPLDNQVEVFSAPGRAANASRLSGVCSRSLETESPSTEWRSCYVQQRNTALISTRRLRERTFRFISHAARCVPTRQGERSIHC